jgi:hypothetical protein
MATRSYTTGGRAFDIVLSATQAGGNSWAWTVEHVFESGQEVTVPGIENVVASDVETAHARVCDRIDKWLRGTAA